MSQERTNSRSMPFEACLISCVSPCCVLYCVWTCNQPDQDRWDEIEQGLMVQTWMTDAFYPDEEEAKTETNESSNDEAQSDEYKQRSSCPICRKRFQTGDQVCSSRNIQCRHQFHKQCIFNWLQYQPACPICNQEYLIPLSHKATTKAAASTTC